MALYTDGTNEAAGVDLMEEYLFPAATAEMKQAALAGIREMLQLPTDASDADCASAIRDWLRLQIRNAYRDTIEASKIETAKTDAETVATDELWGRAAPKEDV